MSIILAALGVGLYTWLSQGGDPLPSTSQSVPVGHEQGYSVYESNCMACHGGDGAGRPGAFPPLEGHVSELLGRDGGREYLLDVVLNGVSGPTEIDDEVYDGFMPGFRQLSDEEIAALMNYLSQAWGNSEALPADFELVTAEEVAERRSRELTPRAVGESQPR
ncbi:cytochrome c [Gammaproteobacteria bacterium AB-CW1]|uniref:Cytochrome c n=2 Tax=Natronospira TaxID=2024969 RepID=A0AAP6JGT8_9GAMM|nr:cytochrome c [Gammaproteobacteria bacterium AB-CW1]